MEWETEALLASPGCTTAWNELFWTLHTKAFRLDLHDTGIKIWFEFAGFVLITLIRHSSLPRDVQHLEMSECWVGIRWCCLLAANAEIIVQPECYVTKPQPGWRTWKRNVAIFSTKTVDCTRINAVSVFCPYLSFFRRFCFSIKKCAPFCLIFVSSYPHFADCCILIKMFENYRVWVIRAIFQNIAVLFFAKTFFGKILFRMWQYG